MEPRAGCAGRARVAAGQLAQFAQWAAGRTYKNYHASIELGRQLPPGTLVHGKLANGLSLENRIRPIFVGRGFGNYEDRKTRDDVRYILTYIAPSLGYESQARNPVIQDVLDAYPDQRIIMTFDVAETATGHDRAALIDKFGGGGRHGNPQTRACARIDERAIKAHADLRFRSEYDYALFEYYRSAKVIAFLERAGVAVRGRVLDAGCGGGGMPLSLAEEAALVVGIDPAERFQDAGVRLGRERGLPQPALRAGRRHVRCPFAPAASIWCCRTPSSSTWPTRRSTCASARGCWHPGGHVYLSTAPYLSFAGAHLPRLKVPVPLHLMVGRRAAFATFRLLARHARLDAQGAGERELVHQGGPARRDQGGRPAREGPRRERLRGRLPTPGCASSARSCTSTATVRRLPAPLAALAARQPADAGRPDQQHGILSWREP